MGARNTAAHQSFVTALIPNARVSLRFFAMRFDAVVTLFVDSSASRATYLHQFFSGRDMLEVKHPRALGFVVVVGALLGTAGLTFAAGESVETVIKSRQTHLKDLGAAFKTVRDELKKSQPAQAQLKEASAVITKASTEIDTWFPKGSGPESKFETDAKAEIWADPAGFAAAAKAFKTEAPKLQQLANANDIDGLKAQTGKLGGACKGCHDKFRVPQD